jgi:hypothetical protein
MDPLAIGVIVFIGLLVALALLSARANAGKPLSEFGSRDRPAASAPPSSAQLEYEDLAQMLEATNARRRARGLPERSMTDAMREFGAE